VSANTWRCYRSPVSGFLYPVSCFRSPISGTQLLLEQLENRCSKWANKTTIGDVFLSIMSFLRGYTGFANNFENALKTISICKQQASFSNCKDIRGVWW